jgi:hypothetical protein
LSINAKQFSEGYPNNGHLQLIRTAIRSLMPLRNFPSRVSSTTKVSWVLSDGPHHPDNTIFTVQP